MKLGVNIDHVATLRQARLGLYPDPVVAAMISEYSGCDSIVAHLREDARHIQKRDVILIKEALKISLNLEMSIDKKIVNFALKLKPHQSTLVPEKRRELTTEGGVDLIKNSSKVAKAIASLKAKGIVVSVFIDPKKEQVKKALEIGADVIEFNTAKYSEAKSIKEAKQEVVKVKIAAEFAKTKGFFVAAGHGLNYKNVKPIAQIKAIEELNIGHSIISHAVFVGLPIAISEMKKLIQGKGGSLCPPVKR